MYFIDMLYKNQFKLLHPLSAPVSIQYQAIEFAIKLPVRLKVKLNGILNRKPKSGLQIMRA